MAARSGKSRQHHTPASPAEEISSAICKPGGKLQGIPDSPARALIFDAEILTHQRICPEQVRMSGSLTETLASDGLASADKSLPLSNLYFFNVVHGGIPKPPDLLIGTVFA
jgi:hypothetical protein